MVRLTPLQIALLRALADRPQTVYGGDATDDVKDLIARKLVTATAINIGEVLYEITEAAKTRLTQCAETNKRNVRAQTNAARPGDECLKQCESARSRNPSAINKIRYFLRRSASGPVPKHSAPLTLAQRSRAAVSFTISLSASRPSIE